MPELYPAGIQYSSRHVLRTQWENWRSSGAWPGSAVATDGKTSVDRRKRALPRSRSSRARAGTWPSAGGQLRLEGHVGVLWRFRIVVGKAEVWCGSIGSASSLSAKSAKPSEKSGGSCRFAGPPIPSLIVCFVSAAFVVVQRSCSRSRTRPQAQRDSSTSIL
jgi:hypothetical protein